MPAGCTYAVMERHWRRCSNAAASQSAGARELDRARSHERLQRRSEAVTARVLQLTVTQGAPHRSASGGCSAPSRGVRLITQHAYLSTWFQAATQSVAHTLCVPGTPTPAAPWPDGNWQHLTSADRLTASHLDSDRALQPRTGVCRLAIVVTPLGARHLKWNSYQ